MDIAPERACKLRWRLDNTNVRVEFALPLTHTHTQALLETIRDLEDSDAAVELPESRFDDILAACRARHVVRIRIPGSCIRLWVRRGSVCVHWESPLIAAQRCEGIIIRHTPGRADFSMTRVSPIDVQMVIARAVRHGMDAGERLSAPMCVTVNPRPPAGAPTTSTIDLYEIAERDLRAYEAATQALVQQRQRVLDGGEAWTRTEKLAKFVRISGMVESVRRKAEAGGRLEAADELLLAAFEEGRAEIHGAGDGEGEEAGVPQALPRTADEMMAAIVKARRSGATAVADPAVDDAAGKDWETALAGVMTDMQHAMERLQASADAREDGHAGACGHAHAHAQGHGHGHGGHIHDAPDRHV